MQYIRTYVLHTAVYVDNHTYALLGTYVRTLVLKNKSHFCTQLSEHHTEPQSIIAPQKVEKHLAIFH